MTLAATIRIIRPTATRNQLKVERARLRRAKLNGRHGVAQLVTPCSPRCSAILTLVAA